jgi:hypothetical protein
MAHSVRLYERIYLEDGPIPKEDVKMALSREQLQSLTNGSVDPQSWGTDSETPMRSHTENGELSDEELVRRIEERSGIKPTYKLRLEYERRLRERGR